jgi:hypothetical protein
MCPLYIQVHQKKYENFKHIYKNFCQLLGNHKHEEIVIYE